MDDALLYQFELRNSPLTCGTSLPRIHRSSVVRLLGFPAPLSAAFLYPRWVTAIDWLLDSDPAVRWQVLRDVTGAPAGEVAAERSRVTREGWGARLLDLQEPDGMWAGGTYFPVPNPDGGREDRQPWTATAFSLQLLHHFGADPADERVRAAVAKVAGNARWEADGLPFFAGEVEPCINGMTVVLGVYFGYVEEAGGVVDRLLGDRLADGGWNCWREFGSTVSSFASTLDVLEGLLAYERATGGSAEITAARQEAEQYLLDRRLFRRMSTGEPAADAFLEFSFPPRWHYDVLRALDYFRQAGEPDPRMHDALDVVAAKRLPDGTWPLENTHPGAVHFELEDGDGRPSRWNTLRALRVLGWAGRPAV